MEHLIYAVQAPAFSRKSKLHRGQADLTLQSVCSRSKVSKSE